MRDLRLEAAILGSAFAFAMGGCGDRAPNTSNHDHSTLAPSETHKGKLLNPDLNYYLVQNISSRAIQVSANPDSYSPDSRAKAINHGVTALAYCIIYNSTHPKLSGLGIVQTQENGDFRADGYIDIYSGNGSTLQVNYTPQFLRRHLQDCPPAND